MCLLDYHDFNNNNDLAEITINGDLSTRTMYFNKKIAARLLLLDFHSIAIKQFKGFMLRDLYLYIRRKYRIFMWFAGDLLHYILLVDFNLTALF